MRHIAAKTSASPEAAEKPSARFDMVSIALHWLTVLLIASQLATAWMLSQRIGEATMILAIHRSMGAATWIVVAIRLLWRNNFAHLPPFPRHMSEVQKRAAVANEYGLYAMALVQPLTGLGQTLSRGRPFQLAAWQVPPMAAPNEAAYRVFKVVHEWGAMALLGLIALHVAAALFHAFILRDGIFRRMLP